MYCNQCGKEAQREASFCANCGARQVAKPPATPPPTSLSSPEAIRSAAPQTAQEQAAATIANSSRQAEAVRAQAAESATMRTHVPQSVQRQAPPALAPPTGARHKPWVWAAASTLAVVLLGGVSYWGWSNKLANDETARKLAQLSEVSQHRGAEAAAADARRAPEDMAERAEIGSELALPAKHGALFAVRQHRALRGSPPHHDAGSPSACRRALRERRRLSPSSQSAVARNTNGRA